LVARVAAGLEARVDAVALLRGSRARRLGCERLTISEEKALGRAGRRPVRRRLPALASHHEVMHRALLREPGRLLHQVLVEEPPAFREQRELAPRAAAERARDRARAMVPGSEQQVLAAGLERAEARDRAVREAAAVHPAGDAVVRHI